jgi:SAM-dependent methyltransferase
VAIFDRRIRRSDASAALRAGGRRFSSLWRNPLADRARLTEILDRREIPSGELARNLRDLTRLNGLPGGAAASTAAIRSLAQAGNVSVVDVGSGRADLPARWAREGWSTVAVDSHPAILDAARAAVAGNPRVRVVESDGRALPFADGAFDVAHCSLLIHHLDPEDAVAAMREMARVARLGVVVNDLRRGVLPFVAIGVAVALLGTCRATRADGLTSVRRAYTLAELDDLLGRAGLRPVWRSNALLPRVVTAAVRTDTTPVRTDTT